MENSSFLTCSAAKTRPLDTARYGIDDPVLLKQGAQKSDEVLLDLVWPVLTIEHELVVAKSTPQSCHELAPEHAAEDFDV